jgi:hypothetical protein
MTLVNLPAPVGVPQLVVTSKEACVVDAHEQDEVLVRLRTVKKESCCTPSTLWATEGNWRLELRGTTVYCYYDDGVVRGAWRAELLPRGQDGKVVTVLNNGFQCAGLTNNQKIAGATLVCLIAYSAVAVIFSSVIISRDAPDFPVVQAEKPYTTDFVAPGHYVKGAPRWRLGDYQLGLRGCDIVMFSLTEPQKDRVIVSKPPGTDCSLKMRADGALVLLNYEYDVQWSSIDDGMPACLKGMTVNKEGFLNCVK